MAEGNCRHVEKDGESLSLETLASGEKTRRQVTSEGMYLHKMVLLSFRGCTVFSGVEDD